MGNVDNLRIHRDKFAQKVNHVRLTHPLNNPNGYYDYDVLSNLDHLEPIIENHLNVFTESSCIADLGCADGDMSFYLEYMYPDKEYLCVDHPDFNWNQMEGIRHLKDKLDSNVNILERNIDIYDPLDTKIDLTLLLGIFYHLKNPITLLQNLNKHSEYILFSTRITQFTPDLNFNISNYPLAYFPSENEINNDSTNWWIFTEECLKKIFARTHWHVVQDIKRGNVYQSNPQDPDKDCRYFALLKNYNNMN